MQIAAAEMEMTAKHQKSLSGAARAKGVVLMFTTTLIFFSLLFQFEKKLGRCVMYGVILFFSPFNMSVLTVGLQKCKRESKHCASTSIGPMEARQSQAFKVSKAFAGLVRF